MDLRENPFRLLGASVEDNRRRIIELSEERAFELDAEICSQARSILTNPQKRIQAEVTWPLDMYDDEIEEIFSYIEDLKNGDSTDEYDFSEYSSLTQLLIKLSCAKYQPVSDIYQAKHLVLSLSRLFDDVDPEVVLDDINLNRDDSEFPQLEKVDEVEEALLYVRNEIRHAISEKLQAFPEKQYLSIITMLAESYGAKYRGQVVIEDVIDDFKLAMNSKIEEGKSEILELIDFTVKGIDQVRLDDVIGVIAEKVRDWDKLVQPIQLISQERGEEEADSVEVANALRDLSIKLYNEHNKTDLSLLITDLLKECFEELPIFFEKVSNDSNVLERIKSNKEKEAEVSALIAKLDAINDLSKSLEHYSDTAKVRGFNDKVHDANFAIKNSTLDKNDIDKLRSSLFNIARNTAIMLHNERGKTALTLEIMQALASDFSDTPKLSEIILKDVNQLKSIYSTNNRYQSTYRNNSNNSSDDAVGSVGCAIILVIVVLIAFGIIALIDRTSSSNSSNNNTYSGSKTPSSTYSVTDEVLFSQNCSLGTKVYANIVSIFPQYGIYEAKDKPPEAVCCKCKTSTGSIVWVYMSVKDYKTYVDSHAVFDGKNNTYDEITYSPSKKIHGSVAKAEAFAYGLEDNTATYIIRFSAIN